MGSEMRIKGKRVFVTGGTGFVGSHLVRRLVEEGAIVSVLARGTSDPWRIGSMLDAVDVLDVDICDESALRAAVGRVQPEIVFHLAAAGVHDPFITEEVALRGNLQGTINVMRAAAAADVRRIVHTGTSYEYGDTAQAGHISPISIYAASKAAAWAFCQMYTRTSGWPIVTLRLFQVYGPGQRSTLIPTAIEAGQNGLEFAITEGEQVRDWVYIDDVVEAFILAAVTEGIEGRTYDVATGHGMNIRDIVQELFTHFPEAHLQIGALPYRPGEVWSLIGNPEPLKDELGWEPHVTIPEGLAQTIAAYQSETRPSGSSHQAAQIKTNQADALHAEILDKVRAYYAHQHAPQEWIPGESKVQYAGRVFDEHEMRNMTEAVLEFWLTAGRWSQRFEKAFRSYLGVREVIPVDSGSSANLVAMTTLRSRQLRTRPLEPGDEVITTAVAFPTTLAPIVQNGLVPVLVDSEVGHYNIDVNQLEAALSPQPRALFITHTLGTPVEMDTLMAFAREHDLYVIEDNCDALGSTYDGKLTGTFGDLATSSFYPAHHITMGEGGAVYTNRPQLAKIARTIRDWGRDCWCGYINPPNGRCGKRFEWEVDGIEGHYDHRYLYTEIGYNLKVTDAQAAVGVAQMEKLPEFVATRKRNFRILYEGLKPYEPFFILPTWSSRADPSWFAFPITLRADLPFNRNDLQRFLEGRRIETRLLFAGNILKQPGYRSIPHRTVGDLHVANEVMRNTMFIGVYPGLGRPQLAYVLEAFHDFIKQYNLITAV
ncbi:MAG: lipopolysaccharide biosynthesis protein RfbH [Anaerolineae bacterium]